MFLVVFKGIRHEIAASMGIVLVSGAWHLSVGSKLHYFSFRLGCGENSRASSNRNEFCLMEDLEYSNEVENISCF